MATKTLYHYFLTLRLQPNGTTSVKATLRNALAHIHTIGLLIPGGWTDTLFVDLYSGDRRPRSDYGDEVPGRRSTEGRELFDGHDYAVLFP